MSYLKAINKVLEIEKGFVNHPADPGGATNWGITQRVYEAFKGRKVTLAEMQNMPKSDAVTIYKLNYWDKINGDKILSYSVAYALFDQAVNRGPVASIKTAQKVLGIPQDGLIGANTLSRLNAADEKSFLGSYLAESIAAYQSIVAKRPASSVFLNGWLNRINEISEYVKVKPGTAAGGLLLIAGLFFLIFFMSSSKSRRIA